MQEKTFKRGFKGVWIPSEIYLFTKLNWAEKILFTEIHSLDNKRGCFASNAYFAKFLGIKEISYISRMISKLKKLDMIYEVGFDGRYRTLKVSQYCREQLEENQFSWDEDEEESLAQNNKADLHKGTRQKCTKVQGSVVQNNKHNNREKNREKDRDTIVESSSTIPKNKQASKKKMTLSSVEEKESPRHLTEAQKNVLVIYQAKFNKHCKTTSKSILDTLPVALNLFENYFKGEGEEKFILAMNRMAKHDYWSKHLMEHPFLKVPKQFFNTKFLENNLLPLVADKKYGRIHKTEISEDERKAIETENKRELDKLEFLN